MNIPNKNKKKPKLNKSLANGKQIKAIRHKQASIFDMRTAPYLSERKPEQAKERIAPNANKNSNTPNSFGLKSKRITNTGILDAQMPKVLPANIKALATISQSLRNCNLNIN